MGSVIFGKCFGKYTNLIKALVSREIQKPNFGCSWQIVPQSKKGILDLTVPEPGHFPISLPLVMFAVA